MPYRLTRMPVAPVVRTRVEALLRERGCVPLPFGLFTEIAEEVGCSRELVRRVARDIGITAPVTRAASRWGCGSCGAPISRFQADRGGLCRACRNITLPCASCGEPVTRPARLLSQPGRSGEPRFFCNKVCHGRWLGTERNRWRSERRALGRDDPPEPTSDS